MQDILSQIPLAAVIIVFIVCATILIIQAMGFRHSDKVRQQELKRLEIGGVNTAVNRFHGHES